MSFDLVIMNLERRVDANEVTRIYHELCDGSHDVLPPSEKIDRCYAELTARYPDLDQLSDEEAEDSPWSDTVEICDGAILMCIRWSRADDMAAYVKALAARHELTCYDPQEEIAHFPLSLPGLE